jgi:hypothetical protein
MRPRPGVRFFVNDLARCRLSKIGVIKSLREENRILHASSVLADGASMTNTGIASR